MAKLPYGEDRKSEGKARADRILGKSSGGYARGGKIKDGDTHISINVGGQSPQGSGGGLGLLSALAGAAPKPPLPMPPPGGGAAAGPPPGLGPMPGMKRGGRAKEGSAAEEATESKAFEKKEDMKKARGGGLGMTAGALSGEGRLEKTAIAKRQGR